MPLGCSRRESSLCTLAPESAQAKRRRVLAGVVTKCFEAKFGGRAGPHAVALRVADFLNKKERAPVISVTLTRPDVIYEPYKRALSPTEVQRLRARGFLDIYAYKYVGSYAKHVGKWVWRQTSDQKARKRAAAASDDEFAALTSELNAA